jgi:hypothetical protein
VIPRPHVDWFALAPINALLVACLLFLSAWPAAITDHSFADNRPSADVAGQFR